MAVYNVSAQYIIVGRITKGTIVLGYVMKDRVTGQIFSMEKGAVEQLALSKQIYNCHAQVYRNIVNMKGIGCKLSELPRYDNNCQRIIKTEHKEEIQADYEIIGKVQSGRKVVGYILEDLKAGNNKRYTRGKEEVLKLARDGKIINAKCQMNGNEPMLRAVAGYDLTKIKVYTLKGAKA